MKHTSATVAEVRRAWDAGLSISDIADVCGLDSRNVVVGIAHRNDFPARPSPIKPTHGAELVAAVRRLRLQGKTTAEIGRAVGLKAGAVANLACRHGLEWGRRRSDARDALIRRLYPTQRDRHVLLARINTLPGLPYTWRALQYRAFNLGAERTCSGHLVAIGRIMAAGRWHRREQAKAEELPPP